MLKDGDWRRVREFPLFSNPKSDIRNYQPAVLRFQNSDMPFTPPLDCLCAGIVVADFICAPVARVPDAGGLVMTDGISLSIGGCAANVAVDLCKLGHRAAVAGKTGSDVPGNFVRESLAASGADTTWLRETGVCQTSATLVINVRGEDRRFIHTFGANGVFS